jgi:hypothetical protein
MLNQHLVANIIGVKIVVITLAILLILQQLDLKAIFAINANPNKIIIAALVNFIFYFFLRDLT